MKIEVSVELMIDGFSLSGPTGAYPDPVGLKTIVEIPDEWKKEIEERIKEKENVLPGYEYIKFVALYVSKEIFLNSSLK